MTRIWSIILVLLLTGIDQLSKILVENFLPLQQSQPFIPFVSFYRTYNTGIAFSWLEFINNRVLAILIIAVIAFLFWLWSKLGPERTYAHLGYGFVMAGAIGNLIDRVARGHVVDFIQFHTQNWSFAIFNLADSFITIGALFIILDEFIKSKKINSGADQ